MFIFKVGNSLEFSQKLRS